MTAKNENIIEIKIEVIPTADGGFVGVICQGNAHIFMSDKCNTEKQAITRTRRAFWTMLDCSHRIKFDTSVQAYPIDCDTAGNEIFGWAGYCERCGYVDYVEEMS